MRAALLALLLAALLSLLAPPARAAMMLHHDLTSLAFQSEAVVLARRGAERPFGPYDTLVEHHVVESYAGPLHPGDVIEVSYDGAMLRPRWGWTPGVRDAAEPVVSDEVILFLIRID